MNIRPVIPNDANEWLRMRTELWPVEGHEAEIAAYFESGGTVVLAQVLVAERERGKLAAFIELGLRTYAEGCESSPVPFIEGWYVDADVRRTGVGAALVRAAEEWARANGHREMASDVELENQSSLTAHRALGYEEVERLVCFRRNL